MSGRWEPGLYEKEARPSGWHVYKYQCLFLYVAFMELMSVWPRIKAYHLLQRNYCISISPDMNSGRNEYEDNYP